MSVLKPFLLLVCVISFLVAVIYGQQVALAEPGNWTLTKVSLSALGISWLSFGSFFAQFATE